MHGYARLRKRLSSVSSLSSESQPPAPALPPSYSQPRGPAREEAGGLADSLEMGREMLEERVRSRSLWLQTALPPSLFIAIGCSVLLVVGALLMPLAKLIQNLT